MSIKKLKNDEDLSKTYCKSIASSISDIIRFSLDEGFRKRCFELFGVSSTKEAEKEINRRLMSIVENGSLVKKNANKIRVGLKDGNTAPDKENTQNEFLDQTSSSSNTNNSNSQMFILTENILKRNWLEISSKQYKENFKRKRHNYYSQPQVNPASVSQYNHSSCSQPTDLDYSPTFSLSKENSNSSLEPLDEGTNYWKAKFKETFKDNTNKYFKKNLKIQKHLSL